MKDPNKRTISTNRAIHPAPHTARPVPKGQCAPATRRAFAPKDTLGLPPRRPRARHRRRRVAVIPTCVLLCLALAGLRMVPALMADALPVQSLPQESPATSSSLPGAQSIPADTLQALRTMAAQDSRIDTILQAPEKYPQELLSMLSRDIELLDFVLGYPDKQGKAYADTIGPVQKGEFPLLLQWDQRWGYAPYGDSCIAVSGCAPTAIAMVAAGLTGRNDVTPYTVAQYAQENGYYVPGQGTSWALMTEGCRYFGIQGTELSLSAASVMDALRAGCPVVCSMRPGDFTTTGHFIVLTGLQGEDIRVNDPNSNARSRQLWSWATLEGQIKNLWVFTA